jgi:phospholipid/cholesterol/gamma-HCH transport system substrate-binding protein
MSAPVPSGGFALLRVRLAGVAFLVVVALLVTLTVLLYRKTFTSVIHVNLMANRIGNQLSAPADVKIRGLVVGEVRKVRSTGDGATIELALQPDKVHLIPTNVTAELLPKTLFGEKYVQLELPASEAPTHLREGSVISQANTTTSRETEQALNDLLPLLKSLKPQDLSMTLSALSTALRGRGDQLGETLSRSGAYFKRLNPALPTLQQDMSGLADFADSTTRATPDLLRLLDNLSVNSRNLVQERPALDAFLSTTDSFAASARSILADNEARFVALARDSKVSLDLFARYAPEFPCLLGGLADYEPIVEKTFGGLQPGLHITLELTKDNGAFVPGQSLKNRDTRGPYCQGLPTPKGQAGDTSFNDGYRTSTTPSSGSFKAQSYYAPTVLDLAAASVLNVEPSKVPDLVGLMLGPMSAGTQVGLS